MRKLMLSLVFVLGAMTMVNANSNVLIDGGASDCVRSSKAATIALANSYGGTGDPNDYMSFYMTTYINCLYDNAII